MKRLLAVNTKLERKDCNKEKLPITPCLIVADTQQPISGSLKDLYLLQESPCKSAGYGNNQKIKDMEDEMTV